MVVNILKSKTDKKFTIFRILHFEIIFNLNLKHGYFKKIFENF